MSIVGPNDLGPRKTGLHQMDARLEHDLDLCMRCAACTATCPTYGVLGHEGFSPRGRVQIAAALLEERLEPGSRAVEFLDTCLHCEACRTACPNGVPVTHLVDLALEMPAMAAITPGSPTSVRLLLWAVPRRWAMALMRAGVWFWQRSGLAALARRWPGVRALLGPLAVLEPALPEIPSPLLPPLPPPGVRAKAMPPAEADTAAPSVDAETAAAAPAERPRVGFFLGCVQEALFAETNRNSLRLLALAGAVLVQAPGQTCCGALHHHQGRTETARALARRNIAKFEKAGADYVVNSAGGCGAMLREYASLLADDPAWAERARAFSAKARDISEFLVSGEGLPAGLLQTLPERITVQDSCHLSHLQGVESPLRELLRPIAGDGLAELPRPDQCCGSAGVYNLERTHLSMDILDLKMKDVRATHASVVATANPGCTLQMRLGVERAGLSGQVRVAHIADLLWEAAAREEHHE